MSFWQAASVSEFVDESEDGAELENLEPRILTFPIAYSTAGQREGERGRNRKSCSLSDFLFEREAFARPSAGLTPYSLNWFRAIESQRYIRRASWIPKVLEFTKHSGETMLGIGNGLGTDWVQYAAHGANVITCCADRIEAEIVQRNFELRGLRAQSVSSDGTCMMLPADSVDVICLQGPLDESLRLVADEAFRVLKPGGKILGIFPARYSVRFWRGMVYPWRITRRRSVRNSATPFPDKLYSGRKLKRNFEGFEVNRIHKRHLRRRDVPLFWRWIPTHYLQRLMGCYLIIKAFKPVSAQSARRAA